MDTRGISTLAIGVLIVVLLWDAYLTARMSRDTMSNVISTFNKNTGGLVALAFAALWIHWFFPMPQSWISDDFRKPEA
jgi:hypothetical protein